MKYETHELVQGSPEWLAHRAACWNASDLATVNGASPYQTRTEFVRHMAMGTMDISVDPITQRRFDDGHRFERLARPLAAEIIGSELFPITASAPEPGLTRRLSASLDGITMDDATTLEHKTLNQDLSAALDSGKIPDKYHWQMEQGMFITGARRCLFMASKWDDNDQLIEEKHCWYESNPVLRASIVPTWKQIEEDVNNYQHVEASPEPVAAPIMNLPAIVYRLNGLALTSNLEEYRLAAEALVERSKKKLETDQDFADQDAMNKSFKEAEERITLVCEQVVGEIKDVDAFTRELSHVGELIRQARLNGERQVKARKDAIRAEILEAGKKALREHIDSLNKLIGKSYMPDMEWADFAGAMRAKKSITSLRDAVNTELANAKIASSAACQLILLNLSTLRDLADGVQFLFADTAHIVLKQNEDLVALIKTRIADHRQAEAARVERERIQKEMQAARDIELKRRKDEAEAGLIKVVENTVSVGDLSGKIKVETIPASFVQTENGTHEVTISASSQASTARPTDDQIIGVLERHYKVHRSAVIGWIADMDLQTYERMKQLGC